MTFHRLYIFCKVYEYQGFSTAANQLLIAQPSVTRIIKSLETDLGTQLIERGNPRQKGITLTNAGQRVYTFAKGFLDDWEQLCIQLNADSNRHPPITIISGCSIGTYILPQLLNEFRLLNSKIVQSEVYIATNFHEITEAIKNKLYDIAIYPDFLGTNTIQIPEQFTFRERLVLIAKSEFYSKDMSVNVEDIDLVLPPKTSIYRKFLDQFFTHEKLKLNITFEISHPESIKKIVLSGKMCSIFPNHAAQDELERGVFVSLNPTNPIPDVTFKVACLKNKPFTQDVAELLTFLEKRLTSTKK